MGTYLPRQLVQEKLNELGETIPDKFGSPVYRIRDILTQIKNVDNYNILKDRVNKYFKKHFNSKDSLNKLDKIIINA